MQISSQLLEHVAYRIANRLLHDFPAIEEVDVELYKQNPPMGADCEQVGISLSLSADNTQIR